MKSKAYLPLASLLITGILGTSGSTAAATINNSISTANIGEIARIAEIKDIQLETIGKFADEDAIETAIWAKDINIRIEGSEISDASLIAIANNIDDDIQAQLIDAEITKIAA
jgi:hypothetical protein